MSHDIQVRPPILQRKSAQRDIALVMGSVGIALLFFLARPSLSRLGDKLTDKLTSNRPVVPLAVRIRPPTLYSDRLVAEIDSSAGASISVLVKIERPATGKRVEKEWRLFMDCLDIGSQTEWTFMSGDKIRIHWADEWCRGKYKDLIVTVP